MRTLEAMTLGTALTLNGCMDYTLSSEGQDDITIDTGYADSGQSEDTSHYVTHNACDAATWDIPSEGTERENCVAIEHYVLRFDSEEQKFSTQLYFGNCPELAGEVLGYSGDIVYYAIAGVETTEYSLPFSHSFSNSKAECSDDGENKNYYLGSRGIILPEYQDVSVTVAYYFFNLQETAASDMSDLEETIMPSLYETITCPADATSATDCSIRMDHYL